MSNTPMLYIFIDESGDTGNPTHKGTSKDYAICACICTDKNIEYLSKQILDILKYINKKEIKYSRLSDREKIFVVSRIDTLNIEHREFYYKKSGRLLLGDLLKYVFESVVCQVNVLAVTKIKVIIDGDENAYYRKLYSSILDKYFKKYTLKFGNSLKVPMLQVADVYVGLCRKGRG